MKKIHTKCSSNANSIRERFQEQTDTDWKEYGNKSKKLQAQLALRAYVRRFPNDRNNHNISDLHKEYIGFFSRKKEPRARVQWSRKPPFQKEFGQKPSRQGRSAMIPTINDGSLQRI